VFHALADPTRRRILELLREVERPAGDLLEAFRISQPAISQHLRVLREAGLVRIRRAGREHLYRADPRPLSAVQEWVGRALASGRRAR
jgi:DNA-binding transcriptional ArsR family regulator